MKGFIKSALSLLLVLTLAFTCITAIASGNEQVLTEQFDTAAAGSALPAGWSFHSYQEEYCANPGASYARIVPVAEAGLPDGSFSSEIRGNVLCITASVDDDAAVYRTIAVEPNTVYRLSCYIKTSGVSGGEAGANIALREIIARSSGVFGDSDWQYVELVGVTSAIQQQLTVSCRLGGYSAVASGEAWFDGFKVEKLTGYTGETVSFYAADTDSQDNSGSETGSTAKYVVIALVFAAIVFALVALTVFLGRKGNKPAAPESSARGGKKCGDAEAERTRRSSILDKIKGKSIFDLDCTELPQPTDNKLRFSKLDWIFVTVLTVVYGAVALFRLGTTNFPESSWSANTGDSIRIEFAEPSVISDVWQNVGLSYCKYSLTTDDGQTIALSEKDSATYWQIFRWKRLGGTAQSTATTGVTLTVNGGDTSRANEPDLMLNELVFFNDKGEVIQCTANGAEALFDEQTTVPDHPGFFTGMYFDELYHGRTAYENINNLSVYEWTHPPLGKLLIALGILIFGMNPFGWRIVGTFIGIVMVPLFYCLAKRLLKRPQLCLLATTLFAFDFMHFAQTRIATIDVYALFFTLLMTYYMYQFICTDIGDSAGKMLKPLALSGLFFGLGCASKWTCIYTGAALALLFFTKLVSLLVKSARLAASNGELAYIKRRMRKRAFELCLWCVIFFIVLPVLIYGASYFRYYTAQWKPAAQAKALMADPSRGAVVSEVELTVSEAADAYVKGVIKVQNDMYNYHSKLNSEHKASSPWWMWIFNLRPTWFYVSEKLPNGNIGTISTFGNPAVWNICALGTFALIVLILLKKHRFTGEAYFVFVCMASSLLPWVFVTRSTYAYHYFSTVPYIILASVYLLKHIEDMNDYRLNEEGLPATLIRRLIPKLKYIWMVLAVVLFALFYPVISGLEVPTEYITMLQWVPYRKFEILNDDGSVKRTLRMGWTFLGYGD